MSTAIIILGAHLGIAKLYLAGYGYEGPVVSPFFVYPNVTEGNDLG
jgi:hypothetical protein